MVQGTGREREHVAVEGVAREPFAKRYTPFQTLVLTALAASQAETEPWLVLADSIEEREMKELAEFIRLWTDPRVQHARVEFEQRADEIKKLGRWLGLTGLDYPKQPEFSHQRPTLAELAKVNASYSRGLRYYVKSVGHYFRSCHEELTRGHVPGITMVKAVIAEKENLSRTVYWLREDCVPKEWLELWDGPPPHQAPW